MDIKAIINDYLETVTKKFFCFEGRADRKSFWTYVLVNFVISTVLGFIPSIGQILSGIFALAVICPSLGITARRMHDIGKSGWVQLVVLIPLAGPFILLYFCIKEGDKEANAYGSPDEK